MTRDTAVKILEQFGGQFGHEYNEALKVVLHRTSPCDVCRHNPPNKPWCRECPATRKGKMVTKYYSHEGLYYEEVSE